MKRFVTNRILIIFSSICIFFLAIEFSIRAYNLIFFQSNSVHKKNSGNNILCIGNSFTKGIGAKAGESYPDHLQTIINKHLGPGHFTVINEGHSVYNTRHILERIGSWLDLYRPQIVLAQIGEPNYWNPYGYQELKQKKIIGWRQKLELVLQNLATYRFVIFALNMKKSLPTSRLKPYILANFDNVGHDDKREIQLCWDNYNNEASKYIDVTKVDFLISKFDNVIKANPRDFASHYIKGLLLACGHQRYQEAIEYLYKFFLLEPQYLSSYALYDFFKILGRVRSQTFQKQYLEKLYAQFPQYENVIRICENNNKRDTLISEWLIHDFSLIQTMMKNRNINFIMMNYPPTREWRSQRADAVIKKYTKRSNVTLIDQNLMIRNKIKQDESSQIFSDTLGPYDDHLNGAGYKIMAENVFEIIKPLLEKK